MDRPPFSPGEDMQYEALRVKSFQNWPVTAPVGATRLARAGFYYSGEGDKVICFSCNGRLQSWQPGDNPELEHKRHFPTCDYINGLSNSNVPILSTPSPRPEEDHAKCESRSDSYYRQGTWARLETFVNWPNSDIHPQAVAEAGFVFTGRTDMVRCVFCQGKMCNFETGEDPMAEHRRHFPLCSFVNQSNLQETLLAPSEESPIVFERPKNQHFAFKMFRIGSFTNWPRGKSQTPAELAHAGFFYAGYDDKVKCFFCNGELGNWAQGDDPWVEHARWFPKCGFVKQCKGVDFIRDIQGKGKSSPTKETTMESTMKSPAVRSVLGMGPEPPNAEIIIDEIFALEENHANRKEDNQSSDSENSEGSDYETDDSDDEISDLKNGSSLRESKRVLRKDEGA
ncbi:inhibitor of apoptosis protein-like [Lingula anatina]|uniref:Inhibitor of apoptosis protein-like n=1 Tax=Lingula anatina TaxID=7574 RepID=A0A1S3IV24_LINAN|nr:inhibitor of apoptosis protein-like [Lingula anatina]|eukprot:XP_013401394.1 inhibitor of apoptosis protein-like [Lingula anatina]